MANLYPLRASFTAGELAPALWARSDLAKYNSGVRVLENFRVQPYGGVSKRNGTKFIQRVGSADGARCRLIPFQFSLDDSYMLEFGDRYVRFYRDGAPVLNNNGTPYEIASPYALDELSNLSYTQSADVLFIVCPTKRPYELARYAAYDWRFTEFAFENGPFAARTTSDLDTAISFSGITGNITVTGPTGTFQPGDVGSIWNVVHNVDAASARTTGSAGTSVATLDMYMLYRPPYWDGANSYIGEHFLACVSTGTYNSYKDILRSGQTFIAGGVSYRLTSNPLYTNEVHYVTTSTSTTSSVMSGYTFTISPNHPYISDTAIVGMWRQLVYFRTTVNVTINYTPSNINASWGINLMVYDTWHLVILGFWHGTIALERYDKDESRWVTVDIFSSPNTNTATAVRNFDISGEVSEPTEMRVRSVSGFTGFTPQGNVAADQGYVELSRPQTVHRGTFRITQYNYSTNVNATVLSDLASSTSSANWQRGAWSDYEGWPRAVGFFEERLVFASTTLEPQTIWMSRTGDYYDFGTEIQIVDDDAITRSLASRQLNRIEAIVPINDLMVLTSGSEWKVSGGNAALTPSNFRARVQGARGCNTLEPIIANATVLFAQAKGSKVNDLMYNYETDLYQGTDLSILAPHIFEEYHLMDWAFQAEPDSMVWMVREDGLLVSLTYLKEHDVTAWARHPMTNATVHAVGCLNGRDRDTVYLIVHRNGVYSVETLDIAKENTPETCYYLDGGFMLQSGSEDITSIGGLEHLEGMEVSLLVDGNTELSGKVVSDGSITLDYPARYVSVGIPYTAKLETLDLGFDNRDGTQLTRRAKVSRAKIRVERTRGLYVKTIDDEDFNVEVKDRQTEGQGSPIELYTGDIDVNLMSTFNEGRIIITSPHPLPATILAIVGAIGTGGF